MLADLEARWRDERTPQAGVRLAQALHREGERLRAQGILDAVEARLREEPRDLASRVAVGAARLAIGQADGAARALEEVVQADPTHLKANKLLVEVYLELDQRDRARDRLDLYRLLNEGDPEIEALEGLVVGVTVPAAPPAAAASQDRSVNAATGQGRTLSVAGGDPFDGLTAQPVGPVPGEQLFDLAPPPPAATATTTLGALYQEQGHREDAERIFRDVIAQEPGNRRAREALAALDAPAEAALPEPEPEIAPEPEPGAERLEAEAERPAAAAVPVELAADTDRERRIGILRDYLERIQAGRRAAAR